MTSIPFARRWAIHLSDLSRSKHCNVDLQRDWLELGSVAFDFSIIEAFPLGLNISSGLKALERQYVTTSECWLYNATVEIPRRSDYANIFWLRRGGIKFTSDATENS
jgi:hypothetical protein